MITCKDVARFVVKYFWCRNISRSGLAVYMVVEMI